MRATEVLQKCLRDALGSMHALRSRVLLRAVEAMIHGSRLTLSASVRRSRHSIDCWATVICILSASLSTRTWLVGWCGTSNPPSPSTGRI